MTRRIAVMLLVLVGAAQLAVPVAMIARRGHALQNGTLYRFRCAPVDPVDPFRGRYVDIAYDVEQYDGPLDGIEFRGQIAFALIERGEDGFARITELSRTKPDAGTFVRCRVQWIRGDGIVTLELPFNRFYMEERKSRDAEELYRETVRDGTDGTWADVRILDGYAVLEELYLDGIPVEEHFGKDVR